MLTYPSPGHPCPGHVPRAPSGRGQGRSLAAPSLRRRCHLAVATAIATEISTSTLTATATPPFLCSQLQSRGEEIGGGSEVIVVMSVWNRGSTGLHGLFLGQTVYLLPNSSTL